MRSYAFKSPMRLWAVLVVLAIAIAAVTLPRTMSATAAPVKPLHTSMLHAYEVARETALDWDSSARLYGMNSVDTSDADATHGLDGSRRLWNVEFVIPGTERHLNVLVDDGVVSNSTEFRNPTFGPGLDNLPDLRMGEIMKDIQGQGLRPGTSIAMGFHFRLAYNPDGTLYLSVIGQKKEGKLERVHLNSKDLPKN